AAERNDTPLQVTDREHQPPAEAVVDTAAALALDDEPHAQQHVLADVLAAHELAQVVPALGRVAEQEATPDLWIDAATLEIGAGARAARLRERLGVEARGEVH